MCMDAIDKPTYLSTTAAIISNHYASFIELTILVLMVFLTTVRSQNLFYKRAKYKGHTPCVRWHKQLLIGTVVVISCHQPIEG